MPSMPHSVRGPSRAAHLRRANHKGTFLFGQIRGHSYFALTVDRSGRAGSSRRIFRAGQRHSQPKFMLDFRLDSSDSQA